MTVRAADALVRALRDHGVDRIFAVPGESYLSVLDALVDMPEIEVIVARHESGAGFMAIADARLTGRPGVAFVSRGPGAMNAAIALHTAQQDAVPLVLFVGQVERPHLGMGAFQEVDYVSAFGSMARHVVEVTDAARLADAAAAAFHMAVSGTPGPVVVSLPEDMLDDMVPAAPTPVRAGARAAASQSDLEKAVAQIAKAHRPLIIAGGLCRSDGARAALRRVAEGFALPVVSAVRHPDLIDNDHPCYAGHLAYGAPVALVSLLRESDLILGVGTRLGDVTSQGYTLPAAPEPAQDVMQVWPDAAEVGRTRRLALAIGADPALFLEQLAAHAPAAPDPRHQDWSVRLHDNALSVRIWDGPDDAADGVVFGAFVRAADELLADDAIVTSDSGNFGAWVQKLLRFGGERRFIAPASGAMGFGVPGAVAASLRHPDRQVVGFVGDGGVLMTGNELATAVQYGARPVLVIADNGSYGTIRMHQERQFPGRVAMTNLRNPDFQTWAKSFGALSLSVTRAADCHDALQDALAADRPAVITVHTSLEHISPATTLARLTQRT